MRQLEPVPACFSFSAQNLQEEKGKQIYFTATGGLIPGATALFKRLQELPPVLFEPC